MTSKMEGETGEPKFNNCNQQASRNFDVTVTIALTFVHEIVNTDQRKMKSEIGNTSGIVPDEIIHLG